MRENEERVFNMCEWVGLVANTLTHLMAQLHKVGGGEYFKVHV